MFIDIHVLPTFYEPINGDPHKEELRHEALDIHLNGIAKLEHIKNQMRCAGLDKMALLAQDYRSEHGEPIVSNDEIRTLVDCEPDRFIGLSINRKYIEKNCTEGKGKTEHKEAHRNIAKADLK